MNKHTGSCLCGEVRFEIAGVFEGFFLCHCSRCRKGTGSSHAANLFGSKATIEWKSGEAKIKTYNVEGSRHSRSFCTECGSAVPRTHLFSGLVVPAGSLETPLNVLPTHICVASKADWDEQLEDAPKFDGLPWQ